MVKKTMSSKRVRSFTAKKGAKGRASVAKAAVSPKKAGSKSASRKGKATSRVIEKKARVPKVVKDIPSGGIPSPEVIQGVGRALEDARFLDYIAKNVGSQANDVLKELSKGPRKDEQLAETVSIKLNEVRRVLNLLNKHGIVRYDVKRDSSGWLTFEWHVDYVAFSDFYTSLNQKVEMPMSALPENCNDFFICAGCSKKQAGLLYPFDVAYEKSFKCNCGKNLEALTRMEAETYMKN